MMLYSKNRGFSLIEILIAMSVLATVFVGIYSFLSSGSRGILAMTMEQEMDDLSANAKVCIESLGYTTLSGMVNTTSSLSFGSGNTECLTGSYNPTLSFTGIELHTYIRNNEVAGSRIYYDNFLVSTGSSNSLLITNTLTPGDARKKEIDFHIYP